MSRSYSSLPAIIASDQDQFCPAAPDQEDLILQLALSVWLKTSEIGLEEARATMLALRRTLLKVAHFDRAQEPIPMVTRDERQTLLSLTRYLAVLADRAGTATGRPVHELAEEALSLVEDLADPVGEEPATEEPLAKIIQLFRP